MVAIACPMPQSLALSSISAAFLAGDGYGTHVRTALYFSAFLGCLAAVLHSFPWGAARQRGLLLLSLPYACTSLICTWRLILLFFVGHTQCFAGHADPPNLFVEAYALVCDSPAGWWWSSTLLLWVAVACPLAHFEAVRRGMPASVAVAYIVVAFLGAVSVAFPLLFSHLMLLQPQSPSSRVIFSSPSGDRARGQAYIRDRRSAPSSAWPASLVLEGWELRWWAVCDAAALLSVCVLPSSVLSARRIFIGNAPPEPRRTPIPLCLHRHIAHRVLCVPQLPSWSCTSSSSCHLRELWGMVRQQGLARHRRRQRSKERASSKMSMQRVHFFKRLL